MSFRIGKSEARHPKIGDLSSKGTIGGIEMEVSKSPKDARLKNDDP